jgi:hypothetical protein
LWDRPIEPVIEPLETVDYDAGPEKKEYREVEVQERKNMDRMIMETIRLDTGEVVSYRELIGLFPDEWTQEG